MGDSQYLLIIDKWYIDDDGPMRRLRGPTFQWLQDGGWYYQSLPSNYYTLDAVDRAATRLDICLMGLDGLSKDAGENLDE